jgi:hypothetical protein
MPISKSDVRIVKDFVRSSQTASFVKNRMLRNVTGPAPAFSAEHIWKNVVTCLLTTQQPSGPGKAVNRFINSTPFPLKLSSIGEGSVEHVVSRILSDFGGIRRYKLIGKSVQENLKWLGADGWRLIEHTFVSLSEIRALKPHEDHIRVERNAARIIQTAMLGFGPKQSRNLWQMTGLTRFEIPLDSRITKWIQANLEVAKTIPCDPRQLVYRKEYERSLDAIQEICSGAQVLPCILDAAVFSSYDREWGAAELIY